jgi:hypothetical protein
MTVSEKKWRAYRLFSYQPYKLWLIVGHFIGMMEDVITAISGRQGNIVDMIKFWVSRIRKTFDV